MGEITFTLDLPPGIVTDNTTFSSSGRWADGDGFRFRGGKPETCGAAIKCDNATGLFNVSKMLVFKDASGTTTLAAAGDTLHISAIDAAGTDITPASGWTTGLDVRRCLAMWGDTLLASVSGGKLFKSAAGAVATEIVNAPDAITCMIVTPSRQVMALGCNEEGSGTFNGRCIRWSDIEDYDTWTTASTNNAGEYILPGQADVVAGCLLGDYILIWTKAELWLVSFIGDPGETFRFTRVGDVGLAGINSFAILNQTAYWFAQDRAVYAYAVGGSIQKVPCPMSAELALADGAYFHQAFACAVSRYGEVWFALATNGNAAGTYYVYCVDESAAAQTPVWFKGLFDTFGVNYPGAMVDSPLLGADLNAYGTTTLIIPDEATTPSTGKPFRFDCIKNTFDTGPTGAYIQTSDLYLDDGRQRVMAKSITPDFEIQSGAVYLTAYVRPRPMAEVVTKGPYTLATSTALAFCLVNDTPVSGDSVVTVDTGPEAMAAGVTFNFVRTPGPGVNAWENGADTGTLRTFTVASDFIGGNGDLSFTPAVISSGADRNVTQLPNNNCRVVALSRKSRKDLRLSGMVFAFKFTTAGAFRVRMGKPVFDGVTMGRR